MRNRIERRKKLAITVKLGLATIALGITADYFRNKDSGQPNPADLSRYTYVDPDSTPLPADYYDPNRRPVQNPDALTIEEFWATEEAYVLAEATRVASFITPTPFPDLYNTSNNPIDPANVNNPYGAGGVFDYRSGTWHPNPEYPKRTALDIDHDKIIWDRDYDALPTATAAEIQAARQDEEDAREYRESLGFVGPYPSLAFLDNRYQWDQQTPKITGVQAQNIIDNFLKSLAYPTRNNNEVLIPASETTNIDGINYPGNWQQINYGDSISTTDYFGVTIEITIYKDKYEIIYNGYGENNLITVNNQDWSQATYLQLYATENFNGGDSRQGNTLYTGMFFLREDTNGNPYVNSTFLNAKDMGGNIRLFPGLRNLMRGV